MGGRKTIKSLQRAREFADSVNEPVIYGRKQRRYQAKLERIARKKRLRARIT